ncbi:MAG: hypothetical protein NE330_24220 [Lentisphaeraceae bacterium]|nr:hypothetical protein [Lentisphaeraceae bacterium]
MIKLIYIYFAILVTASAVIPNNALVTCKKEDGSIFIEFKSGERCACDNERILDEKDKNCCDVTECHDDEEITADCHEENQITSGDCHDTEIEFVESINAVRNNSILLQKTIKFLPVSFIVQPISVRSLIKPFDVGKYYASESEIINQALLQKKTTVFII